jgi:hypothetical protein
VRAGIGMENSDTGFQGAFVKSREETIRFVISVRLSVCWSVYPSVCPSAWKTSAPMGRILMIFNT